MAMDRHPDRGLSLFLPGPGETGMIIRVARLRRGLGTDRLAAMAGLPEDRLVAIENGSGRLTMSILVRLVRILDIGAALHGLHDDGRDAF